MLPSCPSKTESRQLPLGRHDRQRVCDIAHICCPPSGTIRYHVCSLGNDARCHLSSQIGQLKNKTNSVYDFRKALHARPGRKTVDTHNRVRRWYTPCWLGHCPRNHPNDFRLKSKYGVGVDWRFPMKILRLTIRRRSKLCSSPRLMISRSIIRAPVDTHGSLTA